MRSAPVTPYGLELGSNIRTCEALGEQESPQVGETKRMKMELCKFEKTKPHQKLNSKRHISASWYSHIHRIGLGMIAACLLRLDSGLRLLVHDEATTRPLAT
jgi:hypothetical protein